ncbi:MAG: 30S ribosomal protein S9 [Deltaproteobacteria bacterium RIFOXYD12_FULL_50_9]|nr:MAG: 30S ribosomal protein S9 [Deltaproteobacteria bacterium RIFOXYD12_FULL_50_9]
MIDNKYYATGKRKSAVARVWLRAGSGNFKINQGSLEEYFGGGDNFRAKVETPLRLTDTLARFDVVATLKGGGKTAQSEALRHGISRALLIVDTEMRVTLKRAGLLTRDSRIKERKKYGKRSARASFQFSKR